MLLIILGIPPGRVCTYGLVAQAAGLPRRARLVGTVLHHSPLADTVPWHRVVSAAGRVSDRPGGGSDRQRARLIAEAVEISASGRIDLSVFLWTPRLGREPSPGTLRGSS